MLALDCPIAKKDWIHEVAQRNGAYVRAAADSAGKAIEAAGRWEPVVQKIAEFQGLSDDWDGLGARAPSRELLASAIGLAYLLYGKGMDPPPCRGAGLGRFRHLRVARSGRNLQRSTNRTAAVRRSHGA